MDKPIFFISALWLKIAGVALFSIALIFFVIPLFLGIHHSGCITGMIVSILGIIFFGLNAPVSALLQKIWENGTGHIILCVVIGILGTGVILSLLFSIFMLKASVHSPKNENTVVILGCQVKNGKPSLMLKKRLDAAFSYLAQHEQVPVIVCGGQGKDESISESECMKTYLINKGIAENRIIEENSSVSTMENLQNAKEILTREDWLSEITIVTDGFHQLRAANIAKSIGLKPYAISAKTSWYLVPSYWVREWLGICYQFVFG